MEIVLLEKHAGSSSYLQSLGDFKVILFNTTI
jgi:hypothetical protein